MTEMREMREMRERVSGFMVKCQSMTILSKRLFLKNQLYFCFSSKTSLAEVVYEGNLSSNHPNYKRKKVFWNCGRIFPRTPIQPQFTFQE